MKKSIYFFVFWLLCVFQMEAQVHVRGYTRANGTYVQPHMRSSPDGNPYNNYTYPGNTNPYTGKVATGDPNTYLNNYYNRGSSSTSSNDINYSNLPSTGNKIEADKSSSEILAELSRTSEANKGTSELLRELRSRTSSYPSNSLSKSTRKRNYSSSRNHLRNQKASEHDYIDTDFGPNSQYMKDLDKNYGPNSQYMKDLDKNYGPNSKYMKDLEKNYGPNSQYMKDLEKNYGPNSQYMKNLQRKYNL